MIANCEPEELSCPIKLDMIISMYPVSKASKAHISKIKIEQILKHKSSSYQNKYTRLNNYTHTFLYTHVNVTYDFIIFNLIVAMG